MTLTGEHVQLEPMLAAHRAALAGVGLDEDLWKWIPVRVRAPDKR